MSTGLTPGSRFGSYEVVALLGEGGMGARRGAAHRRADRRGGRLMAVSIEAGTADRPPVLGRPEALFETRIGPAVQPVARQAYVVSADGQRFLMNTIQASQPSPLEVILNFNP